MNTECFDRLSVFQVGMHERGAGGGVDRVFWNLYDQLVADEELRLNAFFFSHRSGDRSESAGAPLWRDRHSGEFCLGSTEQPGYRRLWNLRRRVFHELRSLANPDSVVVASHFALYGAALLPELSRMNHVVHFHGPWADETAVEGRHKVNVAMKRVIERAVYSSAKAFVTLSQAFKDVLTNEYQIDPERVHVIPGGVDLEQFSPGDREEARAGLGWPKKAPILFCVRRLVRRMGLEMLVEAFASLASKHPDSILVVGGSGPLQSELEAKVRSYAISNQVRFIGFIPDSDLAQAYRAADISIVPSQSLEGFGLTALESLACGTAAVVTPVGGLPEVVGPLDPNLVLPDKESAAIAQRLDLILNGKLPLPSSLECRRYVEANFSWATIADRTKALYREAASGKNLISS